MNLGVPQNRLKDIEKRLSKYGDICYVGDKDKKGDLVFFIHTTPAVYHGTHVYTNNSSSSAAATGGDGSAAAAATLWGDWFDGAALASGWWPPCHQAMMGRSALLVSELTRPRRQGAMTTATRENQTSRPMPRAEQMRSPVQPHPAHRRGLEVKKIPAVGVVFFLTSP